MAAEIAVHHQADRQRLDEGHRRVQERVVVAAYRTGKTTLLGWFVGQAMKATGGKAKPELLQTLLRERL